MILGPLVGVSLIVTAAIDNGVRSSPDVAAISAQQKNTIMQPLVRSATDCVVRTVAADPRFHVSVRTGDLRDLIVDSMSACTDAMRAMIDAHDRLYGEGSGETFFTGPYLDILPTTVFKSVKGTTD
jgi:hypothetical protein